jgi:hypothetical protein
MNLSDDVHPPSCSEGNSQDLFTKALKELDATFHIALGRRFRMESCSGAKSGSGANKEAEGVSGRWRKVQGFRRLFRAIITFVGSGHHVVLVV